MAALSCPRCGQQTFAPAGHAVCPRCGIPLAAPAGYTLPYPGPTQAAPYAPPPAPYAPRPSPTALPPEALGGHAMASLVLSVAALGAVLFNVLALVAVVKSLGAYFAANRNDVYGAQQRCPSARAWAVGSALVSAVVVSLTLLGWYLSG